MALRYRSLILLACFLLLQLILMAYQLRQQRDIPLVRYGAVFIVTPAHKAMNAVRDSVRGVWFGYIDLRGARRENALLTEELDALKLENHRLRNDAGAYQRLQVLLDLREQISGPTLVAQVISTSSSETAQMLTIDKGHEHGIRADMPVIVPDGVVGKTLHVFRRATQVLLLTDPFSGLAAVIEDTRIHGVLKGQNQSDALLAYVHNGDEVEPGQRVVTSGEDNIFPKGLPVGVVMEARKGLEFQHITVQPLVRLNRLEEVLILLDPTPEQSWPEPASSQPTSQATPESAPGAPPETAPEAASQRTPQSTPQATSRPGSPATTTATSPAATSATGVVAPPPQASAAAAPAAAAPAASPEEASPAAPQPPPAAPAASPQPMSAPAVDGGPQPSEQAE